MILVVLKSILVISSVSAQYQFSTGLELTNVLAGSLDAQWRLNYHGKLGQCFHQELGLVFWRNEATNYSALTMQGQYLYRYKALETGVGIDMGSIFDKGIKPTFGFNVEIRAWLNQIGAFFSPTYRYKSTTHEWSIGHYLGIIYKF